MKYCDKCEKNVATYKWCYKSGTCKNCYSKERYKNLTPERKQKVLKRQAEYRVENQEYINKQSKDYWDKNPERYESHKKKMRNKTRQ